MWLYDNHVQVDMWMIECKLISDYEWEYSYTIEWAIEYMRH